VNAAHREGLRKLALEANPQRLEDVAPKVMAFLRQAQLLKVLSPARAAQVVAEEILRHPGGPLSFSERRVTALRKQHQVARSYAHELDVAGRTLQAQGVATVTDISFPDLRSAEKPVMSGSMQVAPEELLVLRQGVLARLRDVEAALPAAEETLRQWTACLAPARTEPKRVLRELADAITARLPRE
jgi:hypothetical protein